MDTTRYVPIDTLKGLAIISVILLHSWDKPILLQIGAPFHIWQAVPIFIILSAYNGVNSYTKADTASLHYFCKNIFRRFKRLLGPYCIVLTIELLFIWCINLFMSLFAHNTTTEYSEHIQSFYRFPDVFIFIISGGYGPGSYFVPILIPLILTLPMLYLLARRNVMMMLWTALSINIFFELYAINSGMLDEIYRLLFIRYLFAFALGIWLAFGIDYKWLAPGGIISLIYISYVNYFGYTPLAHPSWGSQNVLSFMWPMLLVVIWFDISKRIIFNNIYTKVLSGIGKASYHIFLTQMVYFWTLGKAINMFTSMAFVFNIAICITLGYVFYSLHTHTSVRINDILKL